MPCAEFRLSRLRQAHRPRKRTGSERRQLSADCRGIEEQEPLPQSTWVAFLLWWPSFAPYQEDNHSLYLFTVSFDSVEGPPILIRDVTTALLNSTLDWDFSIFCSRGVILIHIYVDDLTLVLSQLS